MPYRHLGENAEFRGADTNEWFKATFTIRPETNPRQDVFVTTASPYPPDVGKPYIAWRTA